MLLNFLIIVIKDSPSIVFLGWSFKRNLMGVDPFFKEVILWLLVDVINSQGCNGESNDE